MTGNRTLGIKTVQAHPKHQRANSKDARWFDLEDIEGTSLLDVFDQQTASIKAQALRDDTKKISTRVLEELGTGPARLVQYSRGAYGDTGDVIDEASGEVAHSLTEDHSVPMALRCALVVPPGQSFALLFTEHDGTTSLATTIDNALRATFNDLELETEVPGKKKGSWVKREIHLPVKTHQEPEVWRQGAELVQLRVLRKSRAGDFTVGDEHKKVNASLAESELYLPAQGKTFAAWFNQKLFSNSLQAASFLHLDEPENVDGIEVTLENDGKRRTFMLGTERAPAYRRVLTPAGTSPCSHHDFMAVVEDETERFFHSLQIRLSAGWLDLGEFAAN